MLFLYFGDLENLHSEYGQIRQHMKCSVLLVTIRNFLKVQSTFWYKWSFFCSQDPDVYLECVAGLRKKFLSMQSAAVDNDTKFANMLDEALSE